MNENENGFAVWITGLPCSGKTTLAVALRKELAAGGFHAHLLDGDSLRKSISQDLGFSKHDREIHIQRVVSVASSLIKQAPVIVSVISPYRLMREYARNQIKPFIEVSLRCPLAVCQARDVKGLYRLAREGKIKNFTGISDEYEESLLPELFLDTDRLDVQTCVGMIINYLGEKRLFTRKEKVC